MVAQTVANWKWDAEFKSGLTAREQKRYSDLLKVRVEIDGVWLDCELVSLKMPRTLPSLGIRKGWHLALVLPRSKVLVPACDWHAWESESESMTEAMRLWGISPKPVMSRDYTITWPSMMAVAVKAGAR